MCPSHNEPQKYACELDRKNHVLYLRRQLEAEISRDAALSWETMKRTWRWEK